jgi:hypothetical protein
VFFPFCEFLVDERTPDLTTVIYLSLSASLSRPILFLIHGEKAAVIREWDLPTWVQATL